MRRNRSIEVVLVLALGLLCHCASEPARPRPNVIIITIDTLRADRLPFFGAPLNTAPFFADLAERSVVYENAWAPSSWTLPSAVSVITSLHPFQHGVTHLDGLELGPDEEPVPVNCIPDSAETMAETLKAAGYRTYGIASNILVGSEVAFDRGFDRFVKLPDKEADAVNAVAESWREEMLEGEPFFFYLHYFDPHDTFHAREPWFENSLSSDESGWSTDYAAGAVNDDQLDWLMTRIDRLPKELAGREARDLTASEIGQLLAWSKAAYDSEIGYVDSRIQEIYENFGMENAIVVLLADHGEEFYEHSHLTHGQNLYHETMRVPLLLQLPEELGQPGRIAANVSTLDLFPTLRRLLGLPPSTQDQGQDLMALRQGEEHDPVYGSVKGDVDAYAIGADLRSIIVGDYRLITASDGSAELYNLVSDPLEKSDLARQHPVVVTELLETLNALERAAPTFEHSTRLPPPPDEAMLEHLKGLGYVGK